MSSGAVVTVQLVLMLLLGRMAMRVKDSQQSEALGLGLLRCLTRWRLMDSDGLPPTCLWEYQLLSVECDIEIHFYCSVCIDVLCNFFLFDCCSAFGHINLQYFLYFFFDCCSTFGYISLQYPFITAAIFGI